MDAVDPGDDGRGEGGVVRGAVADGSCRTARRARPELRVPGLPGVELHHRRRDCGDGRLADRLILHRAWSPAVVGIPLVTRPGAGKSQDEPTEGRDLNDFVAGGTIGDSERGG